MSVQHGTRLYPKKISGETRGDRVYAGNRTPFDEQLVAEFTPLIELKSNYGVSLLRDITTETNGGTVTNANGEFDIACDATVDSVAELRSAERGRYQPGIVGLPGLALRRPTAPVDDQEITWGYFDDNDGFWFGEDATGVYVQLRTGGTDKPKVYQSAWNADRLDGSRNINHNPSGLTLDLTRYNIFRMPFVWYGGGPIEMRVVASDSDGRDQYVTVHRFASQSGEGPIVQDPNLPVTCRVVNGATGGAVKAYVAGRQFAVLGRYRPNRRITSETRFSASLSGTTVVPLITFRKKSAFASVSVKIAGQGVLSSDDIEIQIILDGSLTGASFGSLTDIQDSETAVEVDTAATAISGGTVIYENLGAGGQGAQSSLTGVDQLGLDIPNGQEISLAVRKVSGTGGTATASFRVEEEW